LALGHLNASMLVNSKKNGKGGSAFCITCTPPPFAVSVGYLI